MRINNGKSICYFCNYYYIRKEGGQLEGMDELGRRGNMREEFGKMTSVETGFQFLTLF